MYYLIFGRYMSSYYKNDDLKIASGVCLPGACLPEVCLLGVSVAEASAVVGTSAVAEASVGASEQRKPLKKGVSVLAQTICNVTSSH
jgi:hypothetical protein